MGDSCKSKCLSSSSCKAIDFFTNTGWCNTFDAACTTPQLKKDGASSYALATKNGMSSYCTVLVETDVAVTGSMTVDVDSSTYTSSPATAMMSSPTYEV